MMNAQPLLATHARRKISLTALIDVVFILLMFFMLTSTFVHYGTLTLNTPTASVNAINESPQLLRILASNSVSIVGTQHASDITLGEAISSLDLNASIVLLPHADMDLQSILSAFETLKSSGAEQLSLGEAWGAASD